MSLFRVQNLNVYYGLIHTIKNVNFRVEEGEIVSLIGANGAGKTTILHAISGLIPFKSGTIEYFDKNINNFLGYKQINMGISHVPEGRRIFSQLSVFQNLKLGAYTRTSKLEILETIENIYNKFPILKERHNQLAGTLSGGEQQMLAIARALMSKPKLLLLDEPSMGLSPLYVTKIFNIIQQINSENVSIILVEQNAKKALSISNRAYILETGKIVNSDTSKNLLNNPIIKKSYLGE